MGWLLGLQREERDQFPQVPPKQTAEAQMERNQTHNFDRSLEFGNEASLPE